MDDSGSEFPRVTEQAYFVSQTLGSGNSGTPDRGSISPLASTFGTDSSATPSPNYQSNNISANLSRQKTQWAIVGIVCLALLALIPPALVFGNKMLPSSASTIVSPVAETANIETTQPTIYSPSDYIYLSQRFFNDAQTLSQIRQQTNEDKKEIIGKLQQAIDTISEGITLYPNRAELWTQRATIYQAIVKISPKAEQAALLDLEQAQNLSQHHPNQPNPSHLPAGLELVKDQQALSHDVIVASPDEKASPYQQTSQSSAYSGSTVIPAGQTSITIQNTRVSDTGPIYIVPKINISPDGIGTSAVLSLMSKIAGREFTVAVDKAQDIDIPFQYWVTR